MKMHGLVSLITRVFPHIFDSNIPPQTVLAFSTPPSPRRRIIYTRCSKRNAEHVLFISSLSVTPRLPPRSLISSISPANRSRPEDQMDPLHIGRGNFPSSPEALNISPALQVSQQRDWRCFRGPAEFGNWAPAPREKACMVLTRGHVEG